MPRTVNPLKAEIRRREILDAAQACFERRGFHGTSMDQICSEANISPGGLYRYFPSKEAIIAAMAEDERRSATLTFAAVRASDNFLLALSNLCEKFVEAYSDPNRAAFAAELMAEAVRNPKFAAVAREAESKIRSDITTLLQAGQELGHVEPSLDPAEASAVLMAAADGMGLRMTFMNDFTAHEAASALKKLVLRFLSPTKAPFHLTPSPINSVTKPIGATNDA
ncbi:TetR/AcrR family transcriptional regulator [Candidatus Phycosocius spiralis]|uniref:TetR family transcriptional regulator n=1 Tax=Candidatus Phycosocius spiralis TaxID=2815099 RepID=A0ABQ4PX38_9PROT|nr:TetR/AcrR family transcriptional regulator [Candidatus Phycosocius spiralis]GIU67649.1 TetR family transcriptional regulator [Candidatus Phycosocius spiralis]